MGKVADPSFENIFLTEYLWKFVPNFPSTNMADNIVKEFYYCLQFSF